MVIPVVFLVIKNKHKKVEGIGIAVFTVFLEDQNRIL